MITDTTHVPRKINNFPQGEEESATTIAVPASILNQLLEEVKNSNAKLANLQQEYATLFEECRKYREQNRLEILSLREEIARLKADQDKKTVPLEATHGYDPKDILFLEEEAANHNAKIITLESAVVNQDKKIVTLENTHDQDLERIALDIASDRQRITKLEQKKPQPLQKDRGEILRALIATNGGKVLAKYARQKMHLDKATFSRLLGTLSDCVTKKLYHLDRRQKLLILDIS